MSLKAREVFIAALAGASLAACDDAPAPSTPGNAPASSAAKPKGPEQVLPPQMVAAVSAGKTASMLGVHFALQTAPTVGKPLPVDIAIVPHRPFTSVRATFDGPDALRLSEGGRFEPQTDVKAETVLSHKLVLQPGQEGVFLVTAAVETEGEDGTVTRIYSIPVIVHGDGASAKPGPG